MAKKETKKSTAMVPWEEELAAAAKKQSQAPKESNAERTFISLKGGAMTLGESKIKGNTLDCIILDFAYVNSYYDKPYNPKELTSPVCYAINRNADEMSPPDDVEDKQDESCLGCPQNEFGSSPTGGKGKACKNNIRLSLIAAGDLDKTPDKWKIAYLNIPPSSLKAFSAFYKEECTDDEGEAVRPTYSFITNILVEPDSDTMFKVFFEAAGDKISREQFYAIRDKVAGLKDDVLFPFPKIEEESKKGKGGKSAGKSTRESTPTKSGRTTPAPRGKAKY